VHNFLANLGGSVFCHEHDLQNFELDPTYQNFDRLPQNPKMAWKLRVRALTREAALRLAERILCGSNTWRPSRDHFAQFLKLNEAEMENLVVAVTRAQGKGVIKVLSEAGAPVATRMSGVIGDTLFAIATGVAHFDCFGRLRFALPKGPRPRTAMRRRFDRKIYAAEPLIAKAAAAFIREVIPFETEQNSKKERQVYVYPKTRSEQFSWRESLPRR
jgi:hypothetical protein